MFEQKLKSIMEQIGATLSNKSADNSLPGNTFYLENGDVLCCDRESGVANDSLNFPRLCPAPLPAFWWRLRCSPCLKTSHLQALLFLILYEISLWAIFIAPLLFWKGSF